MNIRELEKKDVTQVENIYDLYWSGDFRANLSKRLYEYVSHSAESLEQEFKYFVAEENEEIVGIAALRKIPKRMKEFSKREKSCEFYVSAVKYKRKGIGTALRNRRIEEAKKLGYTEAVFYSGDTHRDSWGFHDNSEFKRIGEFTAPNGEEGVIWRMEL